MLVGSIKNQPYFQGLHPRINKIIEYVFACDLKEIKPGKYPIENYSLNEAFFSIDSYTTIDDSQSQAEYHFHFSDIQFLIDGNESFNWDIATAPKLKERASASEIKADIAFIDTNKLVLNKTYMQPHLLYLFTPNTIHQPGLIANTPLAVKKLVIKIATHLLYE